MSKGKLQKFAEMETFANVFQYPFSVLQQKVFPHIGRWHVDYFHNDNPITLELGCGKGEYTVGLAQRYTDRNFIGVDIKGSRMYTGARLAIEQHLPNVAFLRTNIEFIDRFFAPGEVEEIWLTFSDPQMKNPRKRLTSTFFLERYRRFLVDKGIIHLKTDSQFLYTYTCLMAEHNHLPILAQTEDLYADAVLPVISHTITGEGQGWGESPHSSKEVTQGDVIDVPPIQTYYEKQWLERGKTIKYLRLLLPLEGTLEESDIEIPLDDYRSYHRTKRSSKDTAK